MTAGDVLNHANWAVNTTNSLTQIIILKRYEKAPTNQQKK
jgi:hypothetical protein